MKFPNLIEKAFLLKRTFLFADLSLEDLLSIADKLDTYPLDKDEYIFKNNQSALHLYIILQGDIQLLDVNEHPLIELGEGDLFGDEALFNDQVHSYHAKALSKCFLMALTKKHLTTIISECPSVAINLIEAFARQITLRHIPKKEKIL